MHCSLESAYLKRKIEISDLLKKNNSLQRKFTWLVLENRSDNLVTLQKVWSEKDFDVLQLLKFGLSAIKKRFMARIYDRLLFPN